MVFSKKRNDMELKDEYENKEYHGLFWRIKDNMKNEMFKDCEWQIKQMDGGNVNLSLININDPSFHVITMEIPIVYLKKLKDKLINYYIIDDISEVKSEEKPG